LSEIFEFGDEIKGFDTKDLIDPFEDLDIYKEFLGDEEYTKMM